MGNNKLKYSQYYTNKNIAKFMSELFTVNNDEKLNILDPGAGKGSLSATFIENIRSSKNNSIVVDAIEIDSENIEDLNKNYTQLSDEETIFNIINQDFFIWADSILSDQLSLFSEKEKKYSHIIMNPPYKKLNSKSEYMEILLRYNACSANLYSAFLSLAIKLLEDKGELVAIIPRSFCNGKYFRKFRELILNETSIEHLHLFDSRTSSFKADNVLQENLIIKLKKTNIQGHVTISSSTDDKFTDYTQKEVDIDDVVSPTNDEKFFYIPIGEMNNYYKNFSKVICKLEDLDIQVSTGPVVSFRNKEKLFHKYEEGSLPLIYPGNIKDGIVIWGEDVLKKPAYFKSDLKTDRLLYPVGNYVLIRRFSPKESHKRIMSAVIEPTLSNTNYFAFDNGVNVLHSERQPINKDLSFGINAYISSRMFDDYFRVFNGHTQVNATDLRQMLFPSKENLLEIGSYVLQNSQLNKLELDRYIEEMLR